MKKILLALATLLFIGSASFAQQSTTGSSKQSSTRSHKGSKKHKAPQQQQTADTTQVPDGTMKTTMNPTSGSTPNGVGKTAPIQTTTKEKSDNLNDMDESRN